MNKPIILRLRSKDVIHSFGVPEFRVKQDAIPGLTIPIWFVPTVTTAEMRTRTGNAEFHYEIACAQLCGLGHARMRGFVTVQSAEDSRSGWRAHRGAVRTASLQPAALLLTETSVQPPSDPHVRSTRLPSISLSADRLASAGRRARRRRKPALFCEAPLGHSSHYRSPLFVPAPVTLRE